MKKFKNRKILLTEKTKLFSKKIISLCLTTFILVSAVSSGSYADLQNGENLFTDLNGHWAKDSVYSLISKGIKNNEVKSSGNFSPNIPITRGQSAELILKANIEETLLAQDMNTAKNENRFNDTAKHPLKEYINISYKYGLVSGYQDGKFKPDSLVTREEFMSMLVKSQSVLKNLAEKSDKNISFTDLQKGRWSYDSIEVAVKTKLASGYPGNMFKPKNNITRAEAYSMVLNYYETLFTNYDGTVGIATFNKRPVESAEIILFEKGKDGNTKELQKTKTNIFGQYRFTIKPRGKFGIKMAYNTQTAQIDNINLPEGSAFIREKIEIVADKKLEKQNSESKGGADKTQSQKNSETAKTEQRKHLNEVLSTQFKEELGLDKTKTDNDNDGLDDSVEFFYTGTEPLLSDSDGDGVSDANEDSDNDGLTNIEEQNLDTYPNHEDSDYDGVNDYDEVKKYKTNPHNSDTDNDTLLEYEEVLLGLDPKNSKTDGVTPDNKRKFNQTLRDERIDERLLESENWMKVSISGNVPGDLTRRVSLDKETNDALSDNRAVVSDVVAVRSYYDEPLTITFSYQKTYGKNIKNLSIAQFGAGGLELVKTENNVVNKKLSAQIDAKGLYFVIDVDEFLKGLGVDFFGNIGQKTSGVGFRSVPKNKENIADNDINAETKGKEKTYLNENSSLDVTKSDDIQERAQELGKEDNINKTDTVFNEEIVVEDIEILEKQGEDQSQKSVRTEVDKIDANNDDGEDSEKNDETSSKIKEGAIEDPITKENNSKTEDKKSENFTEEKNTENNLDKKQEKEKEEKKVFSESKYRYDNYGNIVEEVVENKVEEGASFFRKNTNVGKATGKADVVFIIDTTGSMGYWIEKVKENINLFADRLNSEHNVDVNFAIFEYRDLDYEIEDDLPSATVHHKSSTSNWFTNVEEFKHEISNLKTNGGGDEYETPIDAIEQSRRLDWRSNSTKFIVLLTDAGYKNSNSYDIEDMEEMANLLAEDNIIFSNITFKEETYSVITNKTGGVFGNLGGNFVSILLELAKKIGKTTNENGEWVFLDDFQSVKLKNKIDKIAETDSDNDGLTDKEELGRSFERDLMEFLRYIAEQNAIPIEKYKGKKSILVWNYKSNPLLLDTDYDGRPDGSIDYDGEIVEPDDIPKNPIVYGNVGFRAIPDEDKEKKSEFEGIWGDTLSNSFTANIESNGYRISTNYRLDYRKFFESNTIYNGELAHLGSISATSAYIVGTEHGDKPARMVIAHKKLDGARTVDCQKFFQYMGLKDIKDFNLAKKYDDDDISQAFIGHRSVYYEDKKREVVFISVRGTDATIEEWSSDFDVGADQSYYWDRNNPDWKNKKNHKGFDVAANRLYKEIDNYLKKFKKNEVIIFMNGHSRGAGISNILGAKFEDAGYKSFTYTFATPNTTTQKGNYKTIFNIVNKDDLVTYLPPKEWGFDKYGITKGFSIRDKYESGVENSWNSVFGTNYNYNGKLNTAKIEFAKITKTREDLYKPATREDQVYIYSEEYNTKGIAEFHAKKQLESYGDRIAKHIDEVGVIVVHKNSTEGKKEKKYKVTSKQRPSFVTAILPDVIATKQHSYDDEVWKYLGIINYKTLGSDEYRFKTQPAGFHVAKAYDPARTAFVHSGADSKGGIAEFINLGGMTHSHMPLTYVYVAKG